MLLAATSVLVISLLCGLGSPALARGLSPRAATQLISLMAFTTSLATGFVLYVVCFTFIAEIPVVSAAGGWSDQSLDAQGDLQPTLGVVICAVTVVVTVLAVRRASAIGLDVLRSMWAARQLGSGEDVVVVDDPRPDAYAVPGLVGGRVVVTSAMLAALDENEQLVVLAHETAHLRHRHYLYVAMAELAAAANPLLRQVPRLVRISSERWADEAAAAATGDRRLTARAVTRAGLAGLRGAPRPGATNLAMTGTATQERTMALLVPPAQTRPVAVALVVAVVLLLAAGSLGTESTTEDRFERAHAAFLQPGR